MHVALAHRVTKGDHGLFPALLVHEDIQHDSALSEQGQSSSLHTNIKSSLPSNDDKWFFSTVSHSARVKGKS